MNRAALLKSSRPGGKEQLITVGLIVILFLFYPHSLQADKFPWQDLAMTAKVQIQAELQQFCDPPGCIQARGAAQGWVSASLYKSDGFYQGQGLVKVTEEGLLEASALALYSGPPDKNFEHYCIVVSGGGLAGFFNPGASFIIRLMSTGIGFFDSYQSFIRLKDQRGVFYWDLSGSELRQNKAKWISNKDLYNFWLEASLANGASNCYAYIPGYSFFRWNFDYYGKNSSGYQIANFDNNTVIKMACSDGGFRVVRIMNNGDIKYIAGCYYPGGLNEHHILGRNKTKFIFYNMKPQTEDFMQIVDLYIYDVQSDTVEKIRYTASGSKDARQILKENTDIENESFTGGLRWTGPPQTNPEALGSVPLTPQALGVALEPGSREVQQDPEPLSSEAEPMGSILGLEAEAGVWRYALTGSSRLKAIIKQGDRLIFRGPGIRAGQVEGNAALPAYGGWQISFSRPGEVVFEATTTATDLDPVEGFLIQGIDGAKNGEIIYDLNCAFMGNQGTAAGPVPPQADIPLGLLLD